MLIFVDDETGDELLQQLENHNIPHESFPGNSTLTEDQLEILTGAILYLTGAREKQLASKLDNIVVTELYRELNE